MKSPPPLTLSRSGTEPAAPPVPPSSSPLLPQLYRRSFHLRLLLSRRQIHGICRNSWAGKETAAEWSQSRSRQSQRRDEPWAGINSGRCVMCGCSRSSARSSARSSRQDAPCACMSLIIQCRQSEAIRGPLSAITAICTLITKSSTVQCPDNNIILLRELV